MSVVVDYILGRLRLGDEAGGPSGPSSALGPISVGLGGPFVVDTVSPAASIGAKWFIGIDAAGNRQVLEILARLASGAPAGNQNMAVGATLDVSFALTPVGPDIALTITNNTGVPLTFRAVRMLI